jgi:hypothetical protein
MSRLHRSSSPVGTTLRLSGCSFIAWFCDDWVSPLPQMLEDQF